jgi:hypothetical protein
VARLHAELLRAIATATSRRRRSPATTADRLRRRFAKRIINPRLLIAVSPETRSRSVLTTLTYHRYSRPCTSPIDSRRLRRDGCVFPIRVLSAAEAADTAPGSRLRIGPRRADPGNLRHKTHLLFTWATSWSTSARSSTRWPT